MEETTFSKYSKKVLMPKYLTKSLSMTKLKKNLEKCQKVNLTFSLIHCGTSKNLKLSEKILNTKKISNMPLKDKDITNYKTR